MREVTVRVPVLPWRALVKVIVIGIAIIALMGAADIFGRWLPAYRDLAFYMAGVLAMVITNFLRGGGDA